MTAAEIAALIAALSQTAINIQLAIQQTSAIGAGAEVTAEQWTALDAALTQALDASTILEASTAARRAAALAQT